MQRLFYFSGYTNNKFKFSWAICIIVLLSFGSSSFTQDSRIIFYRGKDSDSTITTNNSLITNLAAKQKIIDYQKPIQAELNPLVKGFVTQYAAKQTEGYNKMKVWGQRYFNLYDQILPKYGIPKELKYLSVIESYLNPGTISWAGAVGPWQLMPDEADRFGLRRNGSVDERMDFYKSTHAACKLIKELHETFGDWLLVIAAYNGGVGRVKQCIKKAGSKNFYDIQYYLPEETRNHVKKYIATHYIFEGSGGWTTMTTAETNAYLTKLSIENTVPNLTAEELNITETTEVGGRYLAIVVSNAMFMDIEQFNRWNPDFDKTLADGKKYQLRLAKDKIKIFEARKSQILMESVRALLNGDTVSK